MVDHQSPISQLLVAVVDDDTVVREGLKVLLHPEISTMLFSSVEDLLRIRPQVGVVLLDLELVGTVNTRQVQGRCAVEAVSQHWPVLIYTNERRGHVLASCLAAGASGVIHKAEGIDDLKRAVGAIAQGQVIITTALAGLAEAITRLGSLPSLSPRQIDVLHGRARGEPYKVIASRMGIARKTAEEHMAIVSSRFATYLRNHSAADLERALGLGQGDLLEP